MMNPRYLCTIYLLTTTGDECRRCVIDLITKRAIWISENEYTPKIWFPVGWNYV